MKKFLHHLFIDVFEVTNALGSHSSAHKFEVLYLVIFNVSCEHLSKIYIFFDWHMVFDVQRYSYECIQRPIVSLQSMESEQGVTVNIDRKNKDILAIVILFSVGNHGTHTWFIFMESFKINDFCRFCKCNNRPILKTSRAITMKRQTREKYDLCTAKCCKKDYKAAVTSINTAVL